VPERISRTSQRIRHPAIAAVATVISTVRVMRSATAASSVVGFASSSVTKLRIPRVTSG
jgi:hypothetical protein